MTYAASALVSGEAGLAILSTTIFNSIETRINDLPLKVRKVLIVVVQNIVQSPTKMITILYYNGTVSELTKDDLRLIDMINILDVEPGKRLFLGSRVIDIYFKENLSKLVKEFIK